MSTNPGTVCFFNRDLVRVHHLLVVQNRVRISREKDVAGTGVREGTLNWQEGEGQRALDFPFPIGLVQGQRKMSTAQILAILLCNGKDAGLFDTFFLILDVPSLL